MHIEQKTCRSVGEMLGPLCGSRGVEKTSSGGGRVAHGGRLGGVRFRGLLALALWPSVAEVAALTLGPL